jgi:TonB family protein
MFRHFLYITLLVPVCLHAQTGLSQTDTAYFTSKGDKTTKQQASFFRPAPVKEGDKYKIADYYMNGRICAETYSLSLDSEIYDGYYTSYYENGRKKEYGNYIKGNRVGQWKLKYEDTDRIWAVIGFFPDRKDTTEELTSFYRSGKIKRRQWTVNDRDTGMRYNEMGEIIPFTPFEKMPVFKGDVNRFLGMNIRYPDEAREANIQGKALVEFFVHEDGTIETTRCRAPHASLAQEAVRVVKLMPKWQPGLMDDKPVKVYYTLPVLFRLE